MADAMSTDRLVTSRMPRYAGRVAGPVGWRVAIAGVLLVPAVALGHARLVSPPPRTTTIGKTPPCAGAPRGNSPTVLAAGQMLEVDWVETVDHPGHYELAISLADDQNFVTLLGNIPDRPFPDGAVENDYSTMLQIPSTPCAACTLQLIQFMSDHPPGSQYYYSCTDIQIVAGTTSTTVVGGTTSTTTSTTPPGCDGLAGYAAATCLIAGARTQAPCGAPVPSRFQTAFDAGLARIQVLLDKAVAPGTSAKRAQRWLGAAGRRLTKLQHRTVAATDRGRITGSCPQTLGALLAGLRTALGAMS